MQYNPDESDEILNIFKAESEEIILKINDNFLALEKNPEDKTPLKPLLQLSHSLKGAARMLGFNGIQNLTHKLEDVLSFWNKDDIKINPASFQCVYESIDLLTVLTTACCEAKSDCSEPKVDLLIAELDIILNNPDIQEQSAVVKHEEKNSPSDINEDINEFSDKNEFSDEKSSAEYILSKNTDIKAAILELLFVIEKNTDKSDIITGIYEILSDLREIFSKTVYSQIKEKADILNFEINNPDPDLSAVKQYIIDLKTVIFNLFEELNIQITENHVNTESTECEQTDSDYQIIENDSEINNNLEFILDNLRQIRYESEFTKEVSDFMLKLSEKSENPKQKELLAKISNVLNLSINKKTEPDKDIFTVITQCIYTVKRIYTNEIQIDDKNIGFLIQRLTLAEDMLNYINKRKPSLPAKQDKIISAEEYVNLKNNSAFSDLQEIKTLRVDTAKLDNLVAQTGELLVNGLKTRNHIDELDKINSKVVNWSSETKKILNYLKYLEKKGFFTPSHDESFNAFYKKIQGFFTENSEMIGIINNDLTALYNIMSDDDNKLHQNAMEIDMIAKGIRVLPLATIFHSFPRMIRDIAKENKKIVNFIITGSDTTVDKKIIEEIKIPLIHILRNAVSHGIETPQERILKNKHESGTVKLTADQSENNVIITIEDDGSGIDFEKVKKVAIEKGLLSQEEAMNLNEEQTAKLLFLPGFSTKSTVNEISGRGVGLDVVKTKITNLNGDIFIDSLINRGCKITVKLPLTMSATKVFIILVDGQKYALPVSTVQYVKNIKRSEIYNKNNQDCIFHGSRSVPLFSLTQILSGKSEENRNSDVATAIIIKNNDKEAALIVDKLLSDMEIFQKKLVPPIIKVKNISGFTTLSDGEICLIINPYELIRNVLPDDFLPESVIVTGLLPDNTI